MSRAMTRERRAALLVVWGAAAGLTLLAVRPESGAVAVLLTLAVGLVVAAVVTVWPHEGR